MKSHHLFIPITIAVMMLASCVHTSEKQDPIEIQDTSKNKQVVQRYFDEIIDRIGVGDAKESERQAIKAEVAKAMSEVFHPEAAQHFPGWMPVPPQLFLRFFDTGSAESMVTKIYSSIAEGDFVAVHLHHDLTLRGGGMFTEFRTGCLFQTTGKMISWDSMAIFKLKHGKIQEEWIVRDDLNTVMTLYGKEFPCDNKFKGPGPVPIPFGREGK